MAIFHKLAFAATVFVFAADTRAILYIKICVGEAVYIATGTKTPQRAPTETDKTHINLIPNFLQNLVIPEQTVHIWASLEEHSTVTTEYLHEVLNPLILPNVEKHAINASFLIATAEIEDEIDLATNSSELLAEWFTHYPVNYANYDNDDLKVGLFRSHLNSHCQIRDSEQDTKFNIEILAPDSKNYIDKFRNLRTPFVLQEIILVSKAVLGDDYLKCSKLLKGKLEGRFWIATGKSHQTNDFCYRAVKNVEVLEWNEDFAAFKINVIGRSPMYICHLRENVEVWYHGLCFLQENRTQIAVMTDEVFENDSNKLEVNKSNFGKSMTIRICERNVAPSGVDGEFGLAIIASDPEIRNGMLTAIIKKKYTSRTEVLLPST